MRRDTVIGVVAATLAMTGCSPGGVPGEGTSSPPPIVVPSAASTTATATTAPSQSPSETPSAPEATFGATLMIDPCTIVTADEASVLTGTTLGPGRKEEESPSSARCVYGAGTADVFSVQVAVAVDPATAKSMWDQEQAAVRDALEKASGVAGNGAQASITDIPGLGDRAAIMTVSNVVGGHRMNGSSLMVLKGPSFLAFGNLILDQPAPTPRAMEDQARTSLPRLQ